MNYVAYIRPAGSKATDTHVGLTRTNVRSDTYCHFEQNCWVMGTYRAYQAFA